MKRAIIFLTAFVFLACSGPVYRDDNPIRVRPLSRKEAGKLLAGARNHIGEPYRFGGSSRKGWDCSGFASGMYSRYLSYQIPRNAKSLFRRSVKIPVSSKKPGDLVFFKIKSKSRYHVGIYIEGDKFIHASSSGGVIVSRLSDGFYKNAFIGFRRPLLAHAE